MNPRISEILRKFEANDCIVNRVAFAFDEDGSESKEFFAYEVVTPVRTHYFIFIESNSKTNSHVIKTLPPEKLFNAVKRLAFMQAMLKQDCQFVILYTNEKSPMYNEFASFSATTAFEKFQAKLFEDCSTEQEDVEFYLSDIEFSFEVYQDEISGGRQ